MKIFADKDDFIEVVLLILFLLSLNSCRSRGEKLDAMETTVIEAYKEGYRDAVSELEDDWGVSIWNQPDVNNYSGYY